MAELSTPADLDAVMKGSNRANQMALAQQKKGVDTKKAGKRSAADLAVAAQGEKESKGKSSKRAKTTTNTTQKGGKNRKDNENEKEGADEERQEKQKKSKQAKGRDGRQTGNVPVATVPANEEAAEVARKPARAGRSTKPVDYKEKKMDLREQTIAVKEDIAMDCEQDAIQAIDTAGKVFRLTDFEIESDDRQHQPLDWCSHSKMPLWVTGVIFGLEGPITKGKGHRVEHFGPVKGWKMEDGPTGMQITLRTSSAEYRCIRACNVYKKLFLHLTEQAHIAAEIQKALHSHAGGKITCSLDEAIARLSRAKVGKSYSSAREALVLNGNFVIRQISEYDQSHGTALADSPLIHALKTESIVGRPHAMAWVETVQHEQVGGLQRRGTDQNGGIVIDEGQPLAKSHEDKLGSAEKRSMQADADFARQLQAQMDVQDARGRTKTGPRSGQAYIKISEAEIADDYPEPLEYEKPADETDELLLADDELFDVDPEILPRRLLSDFSIYNSEGMMSTLELLPMWRGTEVDTDLYFSGTVKDDDGEWSGGQFIETSAGGEAGNSLGALGSSSSGAAAAAGFDMRIFSSQIQEWLVEFSCDKLFITIRTDVAWYRLASPNAKYQPWFATVLKSARLAVRLLTLLSNEARPSRLSFNDIIKRIAATPEEDLTFISKKVDSVQRYVVVHGQIILNQFKNFHTKAIRECAFVGSLKTLMEGRRHSKLYFKASKTAQLLRSNNNPMRDRASAKAAPMTATATAMVRTIWQSYFPASDAAPTGNESEKAETSAPVEVAEDVNAEDEESEEEDALAVSAARAQPSSEQTLAKKPVVWNEVGKVVDNGMASYRSARIGTLDVAVGDIVCLAGSSPLKSALGLVQAFWVQEGKDPMMQLRVILRGDETVLSDAASPHELFLTDETNTCPAESVEAKLDVTTLRRGWKLEDRRAHLAEDQERQAYNQAAAAEGRPLKYILRTLYLPQQGMFCRLPAELKLGSQIPDAADESLTQYSKDGKSLMKAGTKFCQGDFIFLRPGIFDQVEGSDQSVQPADYASKGRFHKGGANTGLRPYGIAKIASFPPKNIKAKKESKQINLVVQRFYRPEDVSKEHALKADFWEVYASDENVDVTLDDVVSKCQVGGSHIQGSYYALLDAATDGAMKADVTHARAGDDVFRCTKSYNRATGVLSEPPNCFLEGGKKTGTGKGKETAVDKGKGPAADKGKGTAASHTSADASNKAESMAGKRKSSAVNDGISLASMDIFAGCGGLTEGLHQVSEFTPSAPLLQPWKVYEAGAARAKWAIEYEVPAAEAFRLNHPDAVCWAKNCNVILTAAMHKAGLSDLCVGSKEAEEQAKNLDPEILASLPAPGQVEFLCGGPPCQGYSGMNRFNKGNWSMVQNSMVMAYLSFADVYRPRYFLLENVRNFVSHNKSFTFRLTLRSLLDMGYQVRFGVLNAGNFGVSQSRKRTFIWAAAPGELLPDWPKLLYIFRSPQLTINLPGGVKYCAVPQTEGAPLRAVTVRDVISDLPEITNGHATTEMQYSDPPVSAFQRKIRGSETVLRDHICKGMNPLNLERCRCVPKNQPGADWRVLQQIVEEDPSREKFQGQALVPWCLPNTADRHNGWRGLFGRLDWDGHFPTSTTDPQPMGKVGQVFHPSQDRIVSVRECARAQGFPDSFQFYGNVHNKHRQIGNAVPPPLAYSLGRCLRQALEKTETENQNALLMAQMS